MTWCFMGKVQKNSQLKVTLKKTQYNFLIFYFWKCADNYYGYINYYQNQN